MAPNFCRKTPSCPSQTGWAKVKSVERKKVLGAVSRSPFCERVTHQLFLFFFFLHWSSPCLAIWDDIVSVCAEFKVGLGEVNGQDVWSSKRLHSNGTDSKECHPFIEEIEGFASPFFPACFCVSIPQLWAIALNGRLQSWKVRTFYPWSAVARQEKFTLKLDFTLQSGRGVFDAFKMDQTATSFLSDHERGKHSFILHA